MWKGSGEMIKNPITQIDQIQSKIAKVNEHLKFNPNEKNIPAIKAKQARRQTILNILLEKDMIRWG